MENTSTELTIRAFSEDGNFRFLEMTHLYDAAIREMRTRLETLDREFRMLYAYNPIHHIDSRLKSPKSLTEKLRRRGWEVSVDSAEEHLMDIAGIRIVCNYLGDTYRIADMLRCQQDVELVELKDYIAKPKPSGYRSLHMVVRVPVYMTNHTELVPVEIQIRTIAMDFWASLEHELRYKPDVEATDALKQRLHDCAEKSAELDAEMQNIYDELRNMARESAVTYTQD